MAKKIKVKAYDDLRHSLRDALEYERGRAVDLRVTEFPAPPKEMKPEEIKRVRESLNASQPLFASFLCVSTKAVQAWEQGVRRPQKTALRLLDIAKKNPAVLLKS
jgi:putative transcriptional regulator